MNQDKPDTPLEFLTAFIAEMKEESEASTCSDKMKLLINQSLTLADGIHKYCIDMSSEMSSDAKLLAKKTSELNYEALQSEGKTGQFKFFKEMSSDFLQGNFLKMLVRMTRSRRVLEIGTFTGFAALNMAEALPSDGHLVTLEVMPFFADFSRKFFAETQQRDKIEVQTGDAAALLNQLAEKGAQFDFIFVDADKGGYKTYFKTILDKGMLAPNGTIAFDNTLYKGAAFMDDFPDERIARTCTGIREFNEIIKNDPRVEKVIIPTSDGVTIVRRIGE